MAPGVASHVKPVTKLPFGRALPGAARGAAPGALRNGALIEALTNAVVQRIFGLTSGFLLSPLMKG